MSAERYERMSRIFSRASALNENEREAYVSRECEGDAALLREVQELLGLDAGAEPVLDGELVSADVLPRNIVMQGPGLGTELAAGTRLGTYTIEGLVGSGGMGAVYRARQDRPQRVVALKLIRPGLATSQLRKRLELEAELLGRLRHPGIAQIYEAGTVADPAGGPGRPFIAMELVPGPSITAFAERERLDVRSRLGLLAQVCDAVHHAHQRGVIHRDLKPANILMGEQGQPKVLDFGVARPSDADLRLTTMGTSAGQLIGTLAYMSPEQIAGDPSEIDTRADVYALGVVAYELLTGRLPHAVESRSIPDAARKIVDEPPARLSTIDRTLRGDVDTIVGKALAKEKSRRYQSAEALAEDIRAFLEGRPIAARQDSAMYVLSRQVARHKGAVAAMVAAVMGLAVFAIYANWQAGVQGALAQAETLARKRADAATLAVRQELASSRVEQGRLQALSGNPSAGEDLLWPEFLRDLNSRRKFFALWELYRHDRCEATLRANEVTALRVRVSPNGELVASSGTNPAVTVWRASTYEKVAEFGASGVAHTAMAFSATGDLATGDERGRITLWDPMTGREKRVVAEEGAGVSDLVFDATGRELAAVRKDGTVLMVGVDSTAELSPYSLPPARRGSRAPVVNSLVYMGATEGGAARLALGCTDAKIRIVSLPAFKVEQEIDNPGESSPRLAISGDGTRLACGGTARLVRVWDTADWRLISTLKGPNGTFASVSFSKDPNRLATSGWWYVQEWQVDPPIIEKSYSLAYTSSEVTYTPDGQHLWAAVGKNVRCWEMETKGGQTVLESGTPTRSLAKFLSDGSLLTGEGDGAFMLLPKGENGWGTPVQLAKGKARTRSITIDRDEKLAACMTADGELFVIDLKSRAVVFSDRKFWMRANDGAAFNSTADRLVLPMRDLSFQAISIPEGRTLVSIPADGAEALCAAFSPDDRILATTTRQHIRLYNADTGALLRECQSMGVVPWSVVFSPDGSRVAVGNWSRTIDIYHTQSGELERRLSGHRGLVTGLAFRPKEPSILGSSGADGRIMLWDLSESQNTPILTLDGFDGWEVWALDFDRAGRRVLGTGSGGRTVMWDLRYFNRHIGGNLAARMEQHAPELGTELDSQAAIEIRELLLNRGKR